MWNSSSEDDYEIGGHANCQTGQKSLRERKVKFSFPSGDTTSASESSSEGEPSLKKKKALKRSGKKSSLPPPSVSKRMKKIKIKKDKTKALPKSLSKSTLPKKGRRRKIKTIGHETTSECSSGEEFQISNRPKRKKQQQENEQFYTGPSKEELNRLWQPYSQRNLSNRRQCLNIGDSLEDPWGMLLPSELLLKIFQNVVDSEGVSPFLLWVAPAVCSTWRQVSECSSLWTKVDLSFPKCVLNESSFIYLCKTRLKNVQVLNFSGWKDQLSANGLQVISENCPELRSINVSGCTRLFAKDMKKIIENCPKLSRIDVSDTATKVKQLQGLSITSFLCHVATKCCKNLTSLKASCDSFTNLQLIIKILHVKCPNLTELDFSNERLVPLRDFPINIEQLQQGCQNLKILRLANIRFRLVAATPQVQSESLGFPELEELCIPIIRDPLWAGIDDESLFRILKTSQKLKLLDVRGCVRLTSSLLVRLPALDLQHLCLSQCTAVLADGSDLVIQKWFHSLVEIDLSWSNQDEAINAAMHALAGLNGLSILRRLNLTGNNVTIDQVKLVLLRCCKLGSIDLNSCRALPRGSKRAYEGDELANLKKSLQIS